MEVRIDKYLWCIRAFKTRSEATDACNGGKVKVFGVSVKPARQVKEGDMIEVRKGPMTLSYKVVGLLGSRVGAALVENYALNLTPATEVQKMKAPVETITFSRDKGTGRPTKKERRVLDDFMNFFPEDEEF